MLLIFSIKKSIKRLILSLTIFMETTVAVVRIFADSEINYDVEYKQSN